MSFAKISAAAKIVCANSPPDTFVYEARIGTRILVGAPRSLRQQRIYKKMECSDFACAAERSIN